MRPPRAAPSFVDAPGRRRVEPVYTVTIAVTRLVLAPLLRLRIDGAVPADGALVVASNHVSYLDPCTLAIALYRRGRRGRFLTTAAVFDQPVLGAVIAAGRFIPVHRGRGREALTSAIDALGAGEAVVIYPEGAIAKGHDPLPARPGVALLARAAGAPVLPVAQWGMQRVPGRPWWCRRPLQPAAVVFGAPFSPTSSDDADAAQEVLEAVRALLPRARALAGEVPAHR